jgi:hypothetical protein
MTYIAGLSIVLTVRQHRAPKAAPKIRHDNLFRGHQRMAPETVDPALAIYDSYNDMCSRPFSNIIQTHSP